MAGNQQQQALAILRRTESYPNTETENETIRVLLRMPRVRNTVDLQMRSSFRVETAREREAALAYSRGVEKQIPCGRCGSGEAATFTKCIIVTLVDGTQL